MRNKTIEEIKSDLEGFSYQYSNYVVARDSDPESIFILIELEKQEPKITDHIVNILGEENITYGSSITRQTLSRRNLISDALLDSQGNLDELVFSNLNRAIGAIDDGLWPPRKTIPYKINQHIHSRIYRLKIWPKWKLILSLVGFIAAILTIVQTIIYLT